MSANAPVAPAQGSPAASPRRPPRPARRSTSLVGEGLVLLAGVALEAFPVAAWLALLAASAGATMRAALPLWWLCAVIAVAAGLGAVVSSRGTRAAPGPRAVLAALVLVGWAGSVLVSLVLSPAAYAGQDLAHGIASLAADLHAGGDRLGPDFGLALVVAYLWWRGLALTQQPLSRDRLYLRFLIGLGAIILAIAGAAATSGTARAALVSILLPLLIAEVFVGLVGMALAHIADVARERQQRRPLALGEEEAAPVINRAWVATALGISLLVVAGSLALSLVFSYDALRTWIGWLQPVFSALGQVIEWLIEAFALLLFLLLNPLITWLKNAAARRHTTSVTNQSNGNRPTHPTPPTHLPAEWLLAGRLVLAGLVVLVVAVALLRLLGRFLAAREEQGFEEEREALDAQALLGEQLRGLFARRRVTPATAQEDALEPGTVRYLYRELLRTAARRGHPRRASETPDEYARRLTAEVPAPPTAADRAPARSTGNEALAQLTAAYDAVRYGGAPDAPPSPIADAWQRVTRWLTGAGAEQRRRRGPFRRRP